MRPERTIVCGNEAVSLTRASWGLAGDTPANVEIVHLIVFDEAGRISRLRVFCDHGTIS